MTVFHDDTTPRPAVDHPDGGIANDLDRFLEEVDAEASAEAYPRLNTSQLPRHRRRIADLL